MSNDSDKAYPLDVIFNLQTYCTREEAVAIMLGIIAGPPSYHIVDDEADYKAYQNEEEDYEYSLQDHLEDLRGSLVNEYSEAKFDKLPEEEVAKRLETIKKFDADYINKARIYLCHIDDELSKGSESRLRRYQHSVRTSAVLITLKSLDEWVSKEYQLSIFNKLQSNTVSAKPLTDFQHEEEHDAKGRMNQKSARSLYITFGFLLDAFVEKASGSKFGTVDNMNVSVISDHIDQLASKANPQGHGQSSESIKKRIREALSFKKDFIKNG